MKNRLIVTLLLFFGSVSFATDMNFEKEALQAISAHFGLELTDLPALEQDPDKYLRASIRLYKTIKSDPNEMMIGRAAAAQSEMTERLAAEMLGAKLGGFTITIGGVKMHADSGVATINGKSQKTTAKNIAEVNEALQKGYTIALRHCLSNIAVAAEKVLINAKNDDSMALAKRFATSPSVPEDLRTSLLSVFASMDDPVMISWLLAQPDFKDSAKDRLIKRLITEALAKNRPADAENLIVQHLASGLSAQESSSTDVFNYFFNMDDLGNAERILVTHFTRGLSAYEKLAKKIFNFHMEKGQLEQAEQCLAKHYTKGLSERNKLVKAMVEHFLQNGLFDNARVVADRNMDIGGSDHNKMCIAIDRAELAYFKSQKK